MPSQLPDSRAAALAAYLRERASAHSLSCDVNDEQDIATAGMALLDAARLAENMPPTDPRLVRLSEAGRFESMPNHEALFLESPAVRAAMQRPLAGRVMSGSDILQVLVSTALGE